MSVFKCKMCGGALEINGNETVTTCEYCGTQQTLPKLDDDRRANMYDRANHFRRNNEFDKAMGIYEQILNEDNTDAEAYWSLVLCRYGIEYVEDPASHKRIPTVNRAQFTSIFDDENYKSALTCADSLQRTIYEKEAKAINEIQKGILAISQKEEPFDVFICYKETDDNAKERTHDSVLAQDLYQKLTNEGYKVFFSRITLEEKLGVAYEPYIFAALNSAKVMVVLGTKPEYFNAVWVKNEWSRFLSLIKQGKDKTLIPAYKNMSPYDLPTEFSHLQAQDMSKLGFMQDLIRGIKKIISSGEYKSTAIKEKAITSADNDKNDKTATLLKRVFMFLGDGDWKSADEYCEKVLDIDPENAEAYLGKLMIENKTRQRSDLALCEEPFDRGSNYKKIMQFGSNELINELKQYNAKIREPYEKQIEIEIKEGILTGSLWKVIKKWNLSAVAIPNSIKEIDWRIVRGCDSEASFEFRKIKSITIPDSVTSIENWDIIEIYVDSLESITVDKNNTKYKSIDGNLYSKDGNTLIKYAPGKKDRSFVIPDGVTTIGRKAFSNCKELTSIIIPCSVTNIEDEVFYLCHKIKSITVDEGNTKYKSIDGNLYSKDGNTLIKYAPGKKDRSFVIPDGVTTIGRKAFSNCKELTSIIIPCSVTNIEDEVFYLCHKIKSITVDEGNTKYKSIDENVYSKDGTTLIKYAPGKKGSLFVIPDNVTRIGGNAFCYCESLTSITIPENITHIGGNAFCDCESLTSITIPENITHIGSGAFQGCRSVTQINYNAINCADLKKLNPVFSGVGDLKEYGRKIPLQVIIGKKVKNIPAYLFGQSEIDEVVFEANSVCEKIGASAFWWCEHLKKIDIPDSVTSIEDSAFYCCKQLTKLQWGNSVKSIGAHAFQGAKELWIKIPQSVTFIGDYAFEGCRFSPCEIPQSVTFIGNFAFRNSNFTSCKIPKSVKNVGQGIFDGCPIAKESGGCYVATCVYGSYDCPEVWTLRRYRDNTLGSTWYGRAFIKLYYAISPTLVKWFGKTNWFKKMWKGKLDRMVKKLRDKGVENTPYDDKSW